MSLLQNYKTAVHFHALQMALRNVTYETKLPNRKFNLKLLSAINPSVKSMRFLIASFNEGIGAVMRQSSAVCLCTRYLFNK